ncbi:MAG: type 1 glutamine amidotransferase [Betaproteobacteria bacterium]
MHPVAVFRFSKSEGPGRFAEWLAATERPWRLFALDVGEPVPDDPTRFAGIGLMGGPMGANDETPWRDPLAALLRRAVAARVPVIGHCLGGQVLSRALGGTVARAPVTEIGWLDVDATDEQASEEWFGGRDRMTVFQWHYDAFTIPPDATRVLGNARNANQGYVLDDRHIGFQCHVEMTRELVTTWCDMAPDELPPVSDDARQSREDILHGLDARVASLNAIADGVYERWSRHLVA